MENWSYVSLTVQFSPSELTVWLNQVQKPSVPLYRFQFSFAVSSMHLFVSSIYRFRMKSDVVQLVTETRKRWRSYKHKLPLAKYFVLWLNKRRKTNTPMDEAMHIIFILVSLWVWTLDWTQCSFISDKKPYIPLHVSRDSAVGIATSYWLDDRGVGVRVPVGSRIFTSPCRSQTGSGVHPTSYTMGTVGSFPGGKAAGAWSWQLTSN
jgi:hypothetical protein